MYKHFFKRAFDFCISLTALVACVFCLAGGLVFMRYREKDVLDIIKAGDPLANGDPIE